MKKKINFRQMKYWLPAMAYPFLLLLGYLVIDMFNIEIADKTDKSLISKNELNYDLPSAQVNEDIGDKMSNMARQYGGIKDMSAIGNIENDKDSLAKKLDYASKYSDEEAAVVREKLRADSLEALLRARQKIESSDRDQSASEFRRPLSSSDRKKVESLRRRGINVEELERDLGISLDGESLDRISRSLGVSDEDSTLVSSASSAVAPADTVKSMVSHNRRVTKKVVEALDEEADESSVVKRVTETSAHFNTISENVPEGNIIKAIIDEEVKCVDGSRVRLRLLDDVEVEHVMLRKGSYLYAEMSGFGKQRVKGKISSIMSGDNILKCNLNIYDMDGLEGLYVPQSAFRETMKDIGGSAFSNGGLNVSSSLDAKTNVAQFASQALQNAYQRATQSISKAIKKNKVRLKYGTHVYLINGKLKKGETVGGPSASSSSGSSGMSRSRFQGAIHTPVRQ